MNRFVRKENRHSRLRLPAMTAVLLVMLALFMAGVNYAGKSSSEAARDTLERAVAHDVTYCYAMEGAYPESVEYMEKNYNLTYDKDRFYIGYRLQGSNIKPEVTIIELK